MKTTIRRLLLVVLVLVGLPQAVSAQDDSAPPTGQSYLTPYPEGDAYRVQIMGDPYAEGLLAGLSEAFGADTRLVLPRRAIPFGSLTRQEWEDEMRREEASREVAHVGILILGLYDRQNLRSGGGQRSLQLGSDEWQVEWGRRLDRLIKVLKRRSMAVYVLGQPPLRRPEANRDAEMLTDIIRERAQANGVRFVDVADGFQDESGNYIQFGPDVAGVRQRLREADGVTMTPAGNRKLASFVERELRRDLAHAISERAIPLAGNETEQRRINPARAAAAAPAAPAAQWKGTVSRAARAEAAQSTQAAAPAAEGVADQKADNGRVTLKVAAAGGREESITLDIVRPAIPAAVVALLTRRDVADRATQPGEPVVEDLGGGFAVTSSVSTLGPAASLNARRSGAQANRPFVTVQVRGERLPSKPGRADDFTWPKPEFDPAKAAPAAAAPAPARGQRAASQRPVR